MQPRASVRFGRDVLAEAGWQVAVADAAQAKRLAPLACKTDRIDAWVLAEPSRRDLVPAIWLPSLPVRQARELARFRAHLVKHRSRLKQRIHATLMTFELSVGYLPRLLTVPGIGPVLGYTIAAEIGDISRFASPAKLIGYNGLCPRVYQSGARDRRGPLSKAGPKYLR
jgi:transposase